MHNIAKAREKQMGLKHVPKLCLQKAVQKPESVGDPSNGKGLPWRPGSLEALWD